MAGRNFLSHFATFLLLFFSSLFSFANPSHTTYQAKIVKPDGYPLEASSVNFKFTILDPTGACILYSETYSSVNMNSTGGLISFSLGSGVKTYPASSPTFADVFSNITPSLSCDAGGPPSYSPSANDTRKIVMQFHDGSGWQTLPAMNINAVPYAMYADEATKLSGKLVSDFVQVSTIPSCTASQALQYNGSSFSCLTLAGGASITSGTISSALGYTPADGASVTTLSSDLATVSSSVGSANSTIATVSSTVYSVSSTVNALSSTVSSLSSTINSVSSTVSSLSSTVSSLVASYATIVSSQWVSSGSAITYSSGYVGIGTTSPTGTLDVRGGSVASASTITIMAANSNAGNTAGGAINITAGNAFAATTRAQGGAINITAGMGAGSGGLTAQMRGGTISMNAGQGASGGGPGGFLNISAGQGGSVSGAGGSVTLNGGGSTNGIAGNAYINGGSSAEGGGGHIMLTGGYAGSSLGNGYWGGQINIIGGAGINSGLGGKVYISGGLGASGTADILLQGALGNVGVGEPNPTARLNIGAGTATYAPLKFTASTLIATPTSGAVEYDGSNLYYTDGTNTRRALATVGAAVSATDYSSAISATTNIAITPTGSVIVSSTTASTNSSTGALIVKGGLGVSGSIYTSGTIVTSDNIVGASITATNGLIVPRIWGSTQAAANLYLDSTTNSSKGYVLIGNSGGNIGMGTTMPLAKLYVDADGMSPNIPIAGTVGVFDNESANMGIALMTSNNHTATYFYGTTGMASRGALTYTMANVPSQDKLSFDVNFASRMQLNASGSVGIGMAIASTPTAMLQVVNNNVNQDVITLKAAPSQNAHWLRMNDSTDTTRIYFSPNGGMPTLKLGVTNAVALTAEYGGINEIPAGGSVNSTGHLALFNTMGSAGSKVMTGYFNGTNFYSAWEIANVASGMGSLLLMKSGGNVGIGTSTPTTKLDVSGTGYLLKVAGNVSSTTAADIIIQRSSTAKTVGRGAAIQFDDTSNNNNNILMQQAQGDFQLFNNSTGTWVQRFTVASGGAVGVGTANPSNKFSVYGDGSYITKETASGVDGVVDGVLKYGLAGDLVSGGTGNFNRWHGIDATITAGAGLSNKMMFKMFQGGNNNTSGTYVMTLHGNGYVGIGTSDATSRLHISEADDSWNSSIRMDRSWDSSTDYFQMMYDTDGLKIRTMDNGDDSAHIIFKPLNSEAMRITEAGNVGIGTSSPTAKLNISGLGAANATALRIDSQDTYYRDIFMSEFNTTTYGGILRYHSGLDLLQLVTVEAGVEKYGVAVARATGYVGIGMNSAASYPLDVNGDIRITGTPYRAGGDIAWTVPSDARLKDVVKKYDRGLNEILNIDTIIYRYKKGNIKEIDPTKEYSGVLAQQVQTQIPEAVKVDKDGYLSLNTTPIFWAMLNSIKEIYYKVLDVMKNDEAQDRAIASVKEENEAIKAENAKIKQENSEIKAYLCAKDPSAPICK